MVLKDDDITEICSFHVSQHTCHSCPLELCYNNYYPSLFAYSLNDRVDCACFYLCQSLITRHCSFPSVRDSNVNNVQNFHRGEIVPIFGYRMHWAICQVYMLANANFVSLSSSFLYLSLSFSLLCFLLGILSFYFILLYTPTFFLFLSVMLVCFCAIVWRNVLQGIHSRAFNK